MYQFSPHFDPDTASLVDFDTFSTTLANYMAGASGSLAGGSVGAAQDVDKARLVAYLNALRDDLLRGVDGAITNNLQMKQDINAAKAAAQKQADDANATIEQFAANGQQAPAKVFVTREVNDKVVEVLDKAGKTIDDNLIMWNNYKTTINRAFDRAIDAIREERRQGSGGGWFVMYYSDPFNALA